MAGMDAGPGHAEADDQQRIEARDGQQAQL